ncbi:hypothetical protein B0T24DRAFT_669777 [Lasiosphaeria ovina]|uniref:RelA/SpoT domain-containing protein n=1 Tax=Lasiosphaeria ovina TaxID=92902 RepID=A0AAE0MZV1_9PEZI|nr:hypothetical protein B0T24DRAFT_669777 [Lasiosphaeria ovina]
MSQQGEGESGPGEKAKGKQPMVNRREQRAREKDEKFFKQRGIPPPLLDEFLEFMAYAREKHKEHHRLARRVEREICGKILKEMRVKGLLTSRAKDLTSLRKKLPDRAKKWDCATADDVASKIHDLAGVRLALYFPDDVPIVAKVITDLLDEEGEIIQAIIRTSEREDARYLPAMRTEEHKASITEGRQSSSKSSESSNHPKDGQKVHLPKRRDLLPDEQNNGPWLIVAPEDVSAIPDHWRHSGYRSVHLVVNINENTMKRVLGVISAPKRLRAKYGVEDGDDSENDNISGDDSKDEDANDGGNGGSSPTPDAPLTVTKLEIQITTVVMHAWSEVEHDIIYKNRYGLPKSSRMNRMLDGTNGLAITSEILLQELREAHTSLRKQDNVKLTEKDALTGWLRTNYTDLGPYWKPVPPLAKVLEVVLDSRPNIIGVNLRTGKQLREFISKHKIEKIPQGIEALRHSGDIASEILKALGREKSSERAVALRAHPPSHDEGQKAALRDMLLASNALCILSRMTYGLSNPAKYGLDSETIKKFNQIKDILLNPHRGNANHVKSLASFAREFLEAAAQEASALATALARLSIFATTEFGRHLKEHFRKEQGPRIFNPSMEPHALHLISDFDFLVDIISTQKSLQKDAWTNLGLGSGIPSSLEAREDGRLKVISWHASITPPSLPIPNLLDNTILEAGNWGDEVRGIEENLSWFADVVIDEYLEHIQQRLNFDRPFY